MKNLFVSYELTQQLKEKGFNEESLGYYQNGNLIINDLSNYELEKYNLGIGAPLYQQVIDWFREEKGIHLYIEQFYTNVTKLALCYDYSLVSDRFEEREDSEMFWNTYYEALDAAIKDALTLI